MHDAGWHADPSGRYEQRWWDGERWTEAVSTAGATFVDPFGGQPPEPDRAMLERPQLAVDLGPGGLTSSGTWTVQERDGTGVLGSVQVHRGAANTSLATYVVQDAAGRTLLDVRRPAGLRSEVIVADHQGLLVGKKYGLDPEQMVDIINASYGRNAATEFVVKQQVTSGKFAANFKMWLMAKDANVMAETARHVGYSAPLPQDLTAWLADAEKMLGRDVDFTNMYKYFDTFWEKQKVAG